MKAHVRDQEAFIEIPPYRGLKARKIKVELKPPKQQTKSALCSES